MGFLDILCDVFGIETKAEKEEKIEAEQKAFGTSQKVEQPSSEKEKEEKERVWKNPSDPFKYVCQGGTVECSFCSPTSAPIIVTSNTLKLQDKPWTTVQDKDGKVNFNFAGVCKHPSQQKPGSPPPPCKTVISLGSWKDFSETHINNDKALLMKSTIPCNISKQDLKITDSGQKAALTDVSIELPKIQVKILKIDTEYFTPLGIQNPLKKDIKTKGAINIVYEITGQKASGIRFSVYSKDEDLIGFESLTVLKEATVMGKKTGNKPDKKPILVIKLELEQPVFEENHLNIGTHIIRWDGFNDEGVLDTQKLLGKLRFQVSVTSSDGLASVGSFMVVNTEPIVPAARWVKAVITNTETVKNIDVSININLKDGGTQGISSETTAYYTGSSVDGMPGLPAMGAYTIGDWDRNVPKEERNRIGKEPIKERIRSFDELVKIVLEGVNTYWSRNGTRDNGITVAVVSSSDSGFSVQDINLNVNALAKNTTLKPPYALDDIPLIFNTNGEWGRSGNPGHTYGDNLEVPIIKLIDDGLIQQITYNVGYIEGSSGWKYDDIQYADEDFMFTAAHELGHEILQAFGSTVYSWQHKGTSYYLPQDKKPTVKNWIDITPDFMPNTSGENYPKTGEQDLMKYYHQELTPDKKYALFGSVEDHARIVAAEDDVKGLIWLTGIKILK